MTDQKIMKVKLLKPHTHAGRHYPPGATIELTEDSAKWLISLKKATEVK